MAGRRGDPVRIAERHAHAARSARSKRSVLASVNVVEALDALVHTVEVEHPTKLAAVEECYVTAVAAVSAGAMSYGFTANRPRELFAEWVAHVVGARSLADLRTFIEDFWSGPKIPYEELKVDLPRVQHLRRLHEACASSSVWRADPSWPDATARAALEIAAVRWAELSER